MSITGESPGGSSTFRYPSPVKNCWNREIGGTSLLQHKGLSSCSGTEGLQSAKWFSSQDQSPAFIVSLLCLRVSPSFNFFYFVELSARTRDANEGQHPFVGVWHSILLSPIKGSWFASRRQTPWFLFCRGDEVKSGLSTIVIGLKWILLICSQTPNRLLWEINYRCNRNGI